MNLFTTSFDDVVNYDDFIKILYKFGDIPTYSSHGPGMSHGSHDFSSGGKPYGHDLLNTEDVKQKIREGLLERLQPRERDVIERVR